jgi:hypothetical protein
MTQAGHRCTTWRVFSPIRGPGQDVLWSVACFLHIDGEDISRGWSALGGSTNLPNYILPRGPIRLNKLPHVVPSNVPFRCATLETDPLRTYATI